MCQRVRIVQHGLAVALTGQVILPAESVWQRTALRMHAAIIDVDAALLVRDRHMMQRAAMIDILTAENIRLRRRCQMPVVSD